MVELNAADSASLDDIRGIGPAFALRILNYRERVGGYVSTAQLMEVFGLDSLKFSEIKNQVRVDASLIRKININTATAENFKNHPYLRFKQINAIIQYRKQHGNYSNIADLSKVVVIPAETVARLAPYLIY
jgi:competence protein ComEA